jgi:hypothetical protein
MFIMYCGYTLWRGTYEYLMNVLSLIKQLITLSVTDTTTLIYFSMAQQPLVG